jgi:hypothetical protein
LDENRWTNKERKFTTAASNARQFGKFHENSLAGDMPVSELSQKYLHCAIDKH